MNDTENLIRAALARQAERAPHPGPILHALEKPRRRRPWLLAIVGALVVAAAVAIPVAVSGNDPQPPAVIPPLPSDAIPMRYKPTYLPDGMTEGRRISDNDGNLQTRHWGDGKVGAVSLANATGDQLGMFAGCKDGVVVNVNGRPGRLSQSPGGFWEVSWMATQDTCVQVTGGNEATALRVARSVQPDGEAVMRPLLRFGWLPPELTRQTFIVAREANGKVTAAVIVHSGGNGGPNLMVGLHQKGFVSDTKNPKVATVDLKDGRVLRVDFSEAPPMTPEQTQHLVSRIAPVEGVDLSWLGPR